MNLEDIQPWIAGLLQTEPGLQGIPILTDDGSYPKTPRRETALKERGLVLIVGQVESEGIVDETPTGAAVEELLIAVVIEENPSVSCSASGAGVAVLKALRLVRRATISKKPIGSHGIALRSADPPFKNLGMQNGIHRLVACFAMRSPI